MIRLITTVVTPICAILTAATVVTICDCLKLGCDRVTSPEKPP